MSMWMIFRWRDGGPAWLAVVFVGHVAVPAGSSLTPAGDDPERPVRKRSLQLQRLVRRRGHPGLDFFRLSLG